MTSRNDSKPKALNTECQDIYSTKRISDNDIQTEQNDAHTSKSEGSLHSFTTTDFPANSKIKKVFQCNKCTFRTKTTKLLKCHIESKHNVERSLLSCNSCSFQCKQQRTMKIHIASSHTEKVLKVKCDVCDKEFISLEKLKRHKLTHTNTRPFQCAECSKRFKQRSNLTDHMNYSHLKTQIKTKKKTLQCSWEGCDRLFRDKHNLNKHYKTHINARYKCNLCVFQCVYEKVLQKHKEKYHMN
ncbi:hypothetical protein LOTGIDRAFT_193104 [Lottia gigantea]|uniref:C2H2-type domain-containing protein n=1 Tax=Lottia gigantea TaxID=225164 RepID=V3ZWM0_LOTGI|nr:hypothetical protein LOTGIDRAFT_193104 [Lottia gigantea]ESO88797.1 hypothetical protein LOTGIDRAFT_193104 [Lottia gigantea]